MASLAIVVRFATSAPDLHLSIEDARTTSIQGVKRLVRAHLPEDEKPNALRLIHAGRVLDGRSSIAAALNIPLSLPQPAPQPGSPESQHAEDRAAKGKARAPQRTVYIHCAVSSIQLSTDDLAAEAAAASIELDPPQSPTSRTASSKPADANSNQHVPSTTTAARGFDRLNMPAEEVAALRQQHRALVAARHTPDTMPGDAELVALEERWLDEGSLGGGSGGGQRDGAEVDADDHAAQLMDTLYGAVMGFFWPLGCLVWGLGEEGLWSRRRRDAVVAGVFVNIGFAIMRVVSI